MKSYTTEQMVHSLAKISMSAKIAENKINKDGCEKVFAEAFKTMMDEFEKIKKLL